MPNTPYIDVWNTSTLSWDAIDIDAAGICDIVLNVKVEGPATLGFTALQPQHTIRVGGTAPNGITGNSFIRLRCSSYTSGVDPVFEGRVSVTPGDDSVGVKFQAIDPSGHSRFPLMSYGWTGSPAEPVTGGIPRISFNCKQDADDEYAFERAHDYTVAEILTTLLDDQAAALIEELAGPAVGDPYTASDFSALTFKPQEKFIAESEALRPAIMRLLSQYYPSRKLLWQPGTRKWRVFDLNAAPEITVTLNDAAGTYIPLSWNIKASTEGRATAVQIFGPPIASQWDEYHGISDVLSAATLAGATTITLSSATQFPLSSLPFRLKIGTELVTATGYSGNTLTVNAMSAAHSAGDEVHLVVGQLNAATSAGALTLPLTGTVSFPTSVPFKINVEDEVLEVTAVSGTALTIGAARSAHASGAWVYLTAEKTLLNGGLTDISDGPVLETWGAGVPVYGKNKWQITNAAYRKVFRWLKDCYNAPRRGLTVNTSTSSTVLTMLSQQCYGPVLLVRYAANNMGNGLWQTVNGWTFDPQTGTISTGNVYLNQWNPSPPLVSGITGPHVENPADVKLVWCSPGNPLTVRYPTSGFAGTAYDLFDIEVVKRIYDEMMAVGYEIGTAYTTSQRLTQFSALAQEQHKRICDVVYAGGMVLSGLQWDFLSLNKRVNFDAINADGDPLVTGFEDIGAQATDAEFNFSDQTTTIGFNSDQLAVMGEDFAKLKEKLKIRRLVARYQTTSFVSFTPKPTAAGPSHSTSPDAARQTYDVKSGTRTELIGWFDPETGERG